jgi:hypothetical protein
LQSLLFTFKFDCWTFNRFCLRFLTSRSSSATLRLLDTVTQQNFLNVHRTWTEHTCSVSRYCITTKLSQCTQDTDRTHMSNLSVLYHNKTFSMYTEHEQNKHVQSLDTVSQQNFLNVHRTRTEHTCSVSRYYITTKLPECTQNMNSTHMFSLSVLYHKKTFSMYAGHEQNTHVQSFDTYHNKTFSMYTEHEQYTHVQSLDTISQQNFLNVHRT